MSEPPQSGRRRSVGDTIGGFARRVGELIGEVAGQLPDGLREGLDRARALRLGGAPDQSLGVLRALPEPLAAHPLTRFAVGLCHVHDGLRGAKPLRALAEIIEEIGESLGPGAAQLLRAAHAALEGRHEAALDDLRRAARDSARVLEGEEAEARFLVHLLAALSHHALGNEDRTLRELQKARARLPAEAGTYLRTFVLIRGVDHLLAAGLLDDAESWVRDALALDPDDREAIELLARVVASRGDPQAALAQLRRLDDDAHDHTRLWVELTVGDPAKSTDARALALRVLQSAPDDPRLRRLWALAELRRAGAQPDQPLDDGIRRELVEALARAAETAPKGARDRQLHELCHAALRLEWFPESVRQLVLARLRSDEGTAPEELRLVRARLRLHAKDAQDAAGDFVPGDPPRFRADPDIAGAWGPIR